MRNHNLFIYHVRVVEGAYATLQHGNIATRQHGNTATRQHGKVTLFYLEILKQLFILVLSGEDGVCEVAIYVAPFLKAAIIE